MIQQNLGILARLRGDRDAVLACYARSIEAFEAAGDEENTSWVPNNLGKLHGERGDAETADGCFSRALAIAVQATASRLQSVARG